MNVSGVIFFLLEPKKQKKTNKNNNKKKKKKKKIAPDFRLQFIKKRYHGHTTRNTIFML